MTLTRQLLTGIIAMFIVLLIGVEAIYLHSARRNLEQQLNAHANETATSLALTIGSRMQTLDELLVTALVNPVFDRGYFESIEVKAADGTTVFSRNLGNKEIDSPGWFVTMVAFDAPIGQSLISAGWRQLGRVSVKAHPKFAYEQLWETGIATLTWLSVLFAAALIAMRFYLIGILRPLGKIEEAAVSIGNRDFVSIAFMPQARELQRVTQAINSLSAKIRDAITQETVRAERLRREAFEDPATGQLNRRGLENTLAAALGKSAEIYSGALVLFSLGGLEEINRAAGLSKGNEVLRRLCESLLLPGAPAPVTVGRWQGPTFAAFIGNVSQEAVMAWADALCRNFVADLHASGLPQTVTAFAGAGCFSAGETTVGKLASLAEAALAEAASRGSGALARAQESGTNLSDLKAEIESALAGKRVSLLFQKVASIPEGDIVQYEFMSKLTDSRGQSIGAGVFVPLASQYGLLPALDRRVIELAIEALATRKDLPQNVSINVATQSLMDEGFRAGLADMLRQHPHEARRLVFELTGPSASKSPELIKEFARDLRRAGSRVALDNFEMDRKAVALLSELMPAYVKLAPVFTREISERDDARFILEAMMRVFQPLEIPVIAQGVEDKAMVAVLSQIGVSAYQGYALGRPEPLDS